MSDLDARMTRLECSYSSLELKAIFLMWALGIAAILIVVQVVTLVVFVNEVSYLRSRVAVYEEQDRKATGDAERLLRALKGKSAEDIKSLGRPK